MKKIETVVPEKVMESYTKTEYRAEDGKLFQTQSDCLRYEENLRSRAIFNDIEVLPINDVEFPEYFTKIYYPRNDKELEAIKQKAGFYDDYTRIYEYGSLKPNQWIMWLWESGGDGKDVVSFYTLEYLHDEAKKLLDY